MPEMTRSYIVNKRMRRNTVWKGYILVEIEFAAIHCRSFHCPLGERLLRSNADRLTINGLSHIDSSF
jgi:hypothetical protein